MRGLPGLALDRNRAMAIFVIRHDCVLSRAALPGGSSLLQPDFKIEPFHNCFADGERSMTGLGKKPRVIVFALSCICFAALTIERCVSFPEDHLAIIVAAAGAVLNAVAVWMALAGKGQAG